MKTEQGQQYGPVSSDELCRWVAEGRVVASSQVLREGDPSWRWASDVYPVLKPMANGGVPEAQNSLFATAAPQANPFADAPASNPYAAPQITSAGFSSPGRRRKPHRGGAVLTLAILGWAVCAVFGPVAWIMGQADLNEMRAGRMDRSGEGITRAGMILGMVQTIFMGLGLGLLFLMAMLGQLR